MGEVLDAVKGSGSKKSTSTVGTNLQQQVQALTDEVSRLLVIKDNDVATEGDAARPENERKAATLRATSSLLRASKRLLEDY